MDALSAFTAIGVPLIATFVGGAGSYFGFKYKMAELERRVQHLEEKHLPALATALAAAEKALEVADGELAKKVEDLAKELRDFMKEFRESKLDFADESKLATFMLEQNKQWLQMQRTLGQIEGILKRSHPPPKMT